MTRILRFLSISAAVLCFAALLKAGLPQVTTGTWTGVTNMSAARTGACTVALPDGRLLVSGGCRCQWHA